MRGSTVLPYIGGFTVCRKRKARSKVSPTEDEKIEEEGKEERDRARIDDLWASFKQDTASSWRKQTDNKGKVTFVVCYADDPLPKHTVTFSRTK